MFRSVAKLDFVKGVASGIFKLRWAGFPAYPTRIIFNSIMQIRCFLAEDKSTNWCKKMTHARILKGINCYINSVFMSKFGVIADIK